MWLGHMDGERGQSEATKKQTVDLSRALEVAIEAAGAARAVLLAECARPDGPRGPIGHCPADDEAEWVIRQKLLTAFPEWGYLGEETEPKPVGQGEQHIWIV